jgi:hypothetical protein
VRAVTIVVPSRTVIVKHTAAAVSQFHIGDQITKSPCPLPDRTPARIVHGVNSHLRPFLDQRRSSTR